MTRQDLSPFGPICNLQSSIFNLQFPRKHARCDFSSPSPLPQPLDGNGSRYPRVPNWKEGINFQYSQLFGPKFAEYYGYPDPRQPGRFLSLKELVGRGMVHEVWFLAMQGNYGAPYES